MEGLIKGLIEVAIDVAGGHHNAQHPNQEQEQGEPRQTHDERSRSTWAEVVTGEQDDEGQNRWGNDDQRYGSNESQVSEESSRSRVRPHKAVMETHQAHMGRWNHEYKPNREDEQAHNSDGWQTVQSKPSRKPQKVHMDHWDGYKRHPSQQDYSEEVEDSAQLEPSEDELADLPRACDKLWQLDFNRLVPDKDYQIDCGEGKKVYSKEDMAAGTLFTWLGDDVLRRSTFSRFCSLLDNYTPHEGYKEQVTNEERQEQAAFIEEISRTAPIKYLYKYLLYKRIVSENYTEFKRLLENLWFTLYGRGGTSGSSSAFEHVFVGEIKGHGEQQVSGFHNWLQFYLEEAKGRVDYQGYIFPRGRGQLPDSETQLLTIQFEWNGLLKSVSSSFIGVSPEFEVALYTLCFYAGGEDNHLRLGPYDVNVKCYRLGDKIGSAFPIAEN
ncbi:hypothetical protein Drorol1_Dr00014575 [Drosera rotundifolia]